MLAVQVRLLFFMLCIVACMSINKATAMNLTCNAENKLSACVDDLASAGGGTLYLKKGTYRIDNTIIMKSNVNIVGTGSDTIITWAPGIKNIINSPLFYSKNVNDIVIEDVKIVGGIDQNPISHDLRDNQIGVYFDCNGDPFKGEKTTCNNIALNNIEVENCSHGIHIKGATHVNTLDLKLHNNGNTTKNYFHNIYFRRVADLRVIQSKMGSGGFYDSPRGHGIRGSHLKDVYMSNLDVYGNADYGIHMDTVLNVRLHKLNIHDNCRSGEPGCVQIKCFGPQCDINLNARAE